MKTCPQCKTSWYHTYANGIWKEGYCQYCAYESREASNENDLPTISIAPRPKESKQPHWTKQ